MGTLTQNPYGHFLYRFESGSCLGPATFSWESEGTPHVQNMNIEPNGNEPPECGPIQPGTAVTGTGSFSETGVSINCLDWDFDGSGQDQVLSATTNPAHGTVSTFDSDDSFLIPKREFDYHYMFASPATSDFFGITISDDYAPNLKSLAPINISVNFAAPLSCAYLLQPTGQRAAALKKCKKTPKGPKRKKCIKKAKKLPV